MRPRRRVAPSKAPLPQRESELCDRFVNLIGRSDVVAYPETAGFDILIRVSDNPSRSLLSMSDLKPGDMIGIEAKMSPNLKVLAQAIDRGYASRQRTGPDFRAVLVPKASRDFRDVAHALNVVVIVPEWSSLRPRWLNGFQARRRWSPKARPTLPPIVPTMSAGMPAPRILSTWRINALKTVIALEGKIFTRRELTEVAGIGAQLWADRRWIVPVQPSQMRGRAILHTMNPEASGFPSCGYEGELELLRDSDDTGC